MTAGILLLMCLALSVVNRIRHPPYLVRFERLSGRLRAKRGHGRTSFSRPSSTRRVSCRPVIFVQEKLDEPARKRFDLSYG